MKILNNGYFSDTLDSNNLSVGLTSNTSSVLNDKSLEECIGLIGIDGILQPLPEISLAAIYSNDLVIKDDFPFPQLHITDKFIIVCNRNSILEVSSDGTLCKKFTTISSGLWAIFASNDFLYLSNGLVSVSRNPLDGRYSYVDAPICNALCNFNGQVICGNIRNIYLKYNGTVLYDGTVTY